MFTHDLVSHLVSERGLVARYDAIGRSYSKTRREVPRFHVRMHAGLANARTVVNVGGREGARA